MAKMKNNDRGELKSRIILGIILYAISCLLLELVFKGTGWHLWSLIGLAIGMAGMLNIIFPTICLLEEKT